MSKIVMVSGAWHGKWCWERVVPLLTDRGFDVITPELLGMGDDKTPLKDVTLARWTDQIAQVVVDQNEPVVLLGHSRGGIVISEVAEKVPQSISQLIYLSAFMLRDGESMGTVLARRASDAKPNFLQPAADGASATVMPEFIDKVFYNTTSPELVERAKKRMGGEPLTSFGTPLHLTRERYETVPRAYIECQRDRAVPLELQRELQAQLPCYPVATMDTDHCPFMSDPEGLVEAIAKVVQEQADKYPNGHRSELQR